VLRTCNVTWRLGSFSPGACGVGVIDGWEPVDQQVVQLINGEMEAGYHDVRFGGKGLSSGVYFYRMQAGDYIQTRKVLLCK